MSNKRFFKESNEIRNAIKYRIKQVTDAIPHKKIRDIVGQRNNTSSFLKGTVGYLIHEGVGGRLSKKNKINLATGIEVLCSSGAIFDNAIDNHEERNGHTTFLKEYGVWMQIAASQYVLHQGLKILFPFMHSFVKNFAHKYSVEDAVIGMVGTDIEKSTSFKRHLETIKRSNGRFFEVPLIIAATSGTEDKSIIDDISAYGLNLGTALGIYEEIRDLLGKHGRKKATEIESGRFILALHVSNESGFSVENYVGKPLDDREYKNLIDIIFRSGAIKKTQKLIIKHFSEAERALKNAVDEKCFYTLDNLRESVCRELEKIVEDAERKYG